MEKKSWTKAEEETLKKVYSSEEPYYTLNEICLKLGRSKKAISHKAIRIGAKRFTKQKNPNPPKSKEHRKEYDEKWYNKNKERIMKLRMLRRHKLKEELVLLLGGVCSNPECTEQRIPTLDFHHKGDKDENIARLISRGFRKKAFVEIKKCILLCSNCHRIFHYGNVVGENR